MNYIKTIRRAKRRLPAPVFWLAMVLASPLVIVGAFYVALLAGSWEDCPNPNFNGFN